MRIVNIHIIAALCAIIALQSCSNDTTTLPGFEADITTIEAEASGGSYDISIRSSQEWTAVADVPWVMVSPANGRGEVRCSIRVDSTLINDMRNTEIRFSSGGKVLKNIAITQHGYARQVTPELSEYRLAASAPRIDRWFEFDVESNVEFDVVAEYDSDEEWLSIDDFNIVLDRGARPRSTRLHMEWKMNTEPKERVATLYFTAKDGTPLATSNRLVVRQNSAPVIKDNRQGDSLAVVTIHSKLECWSENAISTTEAMSRWESVRLWEATDSSLPSPEAVGRVRDLDLSYFNTEDGVPVEIKHLRYLETLSLFGNVNTMLKSIDLGEEICQLEHLKALRIAAFGLVSLPEGFAKLGATLETLDLNSNNFNSIPEVITRENFPKLRSLNLSSNRRASIADLRTRSSADERGIGLHSDLDDSDAVKRLLLWEELEELSLSYNYIEGKLPDFEAGKEGVRAYTEEDVARYGDTVDWAVEAQLPRILPNMRALRINLNFMSGELPDWLLYHPRLLEWGPEILVFPQQESATDSDGKAAGFSNVPKSTEYYFERYPLYRGRYEFNDEME
ncbi:MAG: hypothetical protein E7146_03205 [Rikenellaceae bacterium]|nr:hypothetical protein [Rikenellaceae bacterium]